jgi:NADH-quinone oxidoreductase subunit J
MELPVFSVLAVVIVASALLCITRRNPISAAMWLVSTMLALGFLFVVLGAEFIGIIQVLVYAGAIMVLFLFVIMLLNVGHAPSDLRRWPAWVLALALVGTLTLQLLVLGRYSPERLALEYSGNPSADPDSVFHGAQVLQAQVASHGVVGAMAQPLFSTYLIPFELTSILLLAAIVGAVVLAKKRL